MILVVFDIDGTLTDTKKVDDQCFLDSLQDCWQCDLGEVDWSTYPNVTDTGLAREIYKAFYKEEISESELNQFKKLFFSKIFRASETDPEGFLEIKGASAFLKELNLHDIKISFATGGWETTARHKLQKVNIDMSQYPYATSDDHFSRREIMVKSIERAKMKCKIDFSKVIYIGDGLWDLKTASELNVGFIGIDSKNSGKLKEAGASVVFKNYLDKDSLLDCIKSEEI